MATELPTTAEEHVEQPPLTYKTHVLKVSIHCEGCKRKVKKVLHSVEGVYKADIDTKLQKVTVTGNVEAQTLLKKLLKSNKHAELWPEPPEQKDKKSRKSKKKEKKNDPDSSNDDDDPEAEKPPVKVEVDQEPARISEAVSNPAKVTGGGGVPVKTSGGAVRFSEVGAKTSGGPVVAGGGVAKTGGGPVVETKVEGKKPETGSAVNQSPAVEKKGGGGESDNFTEKSGSAGGGNGSGSGGKKKKKKGQKVGFEGVPSSGGAAPSTMQPNHYAGPPQVNLSPPRHHGHQFPPPNYYAPPQPPVYVMSYNTAHPTSSYTTSYYSSPQQPHSYAYTYSGPETEPHPSDFESYPRQPDSFEMFSDENPNGCSVM